MVNAKLKRKFTILDLLYHTTPLITTHTHTELCERSVDEIST